MIVTESKLLAKLFLNVGNAMQSKAGQWQVWMMHYKLYQNLVKRSL